MCLCVQKADSTFMAASPGHAIHPTKEQGFLPDLHPTRKIQEHPRNSSGEVSAAETSYRAVNAAKGAHVDRRPGVVPSERVAAHPTLRSGFLGDLPPTAARQQALAAETANSCLAGTYTALVDEQEEPLVGALLS
jgi:hypothetical protein